MISCLTKMSSFYFVILLSAWIVMSFSNDSSSMFDESFFSEPLTSISLFSTALKSSFSFLTLSFRILCCSAISSCFFWATYTSFWRSFFSSRVRSPLALATLRYINWIWYSALYKSSCCFWNSWFNLLMWDWRFLQAAIIPWISP